jgi:hypothetical protein
MLAEAEEEIGSREGEEATRYEMGVRVDGDLLACWGRVKSACELNGDASWSADDGGEKVGRETDDRRGGWDIHLTC